MTQAKGVRPGAGILAWLAATAFLAGLTALVFGELRRFDVEPIAWPEDRGFARLESGPSSPWLVEGEPGAVEVAGGVLRVRAGTGEVALRQGWDLPAMAPRAFRVAATVGTSALGGQAEIALVADSDIGRRDLGAIHQLVRLGTAKAPARYVAQFVFPASARRIELAIRLRGEAGEMTVQGLEVRGLRERWPVREGRIALQVAWALTLAWGCWWFARGVDDRRSAGLLAAAAGGGLVLLLLPQDWRNGLLVPLAASLPERTLAVEQVGDLGHLAIFAAVGLLVRLSRRRDPAWLQLALLVAIAGLAEQLQYLTELRSPTLPDWLTNAAGALAGWFAAAAWLRFQEGQPETQRRSSTTTPPQEAKQRR